MDTPDLKFIVSSYTYQVTHPTRISGIEDITVFNLLKSLASGKIKVHRMKQKLVSIRTNMLFCECYRMHETLSHDWMS